MDVTSVLIAAQSADQAARSQAEQTLQQAQASSLPMYLLTLVGELSNEAKPAGARQLAGILVKNALSAPRDAQRSAALRESYIAIDPTYKGQIKQTLLACLKSQASEVRHVAAQVIASVAIIELPRKEWSDLIPTLCAPSVTKQEDFLRESTLQCLGYICEEVEQAAIANHTNVILTAVVSGAADTEPNNAVKLAALSALLNSLEFARPNFDKEHERTFIMRVVVAACKASEARIRAKAYECLCRIAGLYYDKLAAYMQAIFDATIMTIKNTSEAESVALQAVEFWSTLADIETVLREDAEAAAEERRQVPPNELSQNFVSGALQYLFEALASCMVRQEDDQDEDAWNISLAAATCLALVAQCVRDAIVQPAFGFVATNIESADWHNREAATVAFGTVLEGPTNLQTMLSNGQALQILVKHLRDPEEIVRDSSAWAIGRLASTLPEVLVLPNDRLDSVVAALLAGLKDTPRVACTCAWALNNISESCELISEEENPATGPFSRFFQYVVAELFAAADRTDVEDGKLRRAAFGAMAEIVHSCATDCVPGAQQLLSSVANRLNAAQQEDTAVLLVSVMTEAIKRLGASGLTGIPGAADGLMTLLMRLFQSGTRNTALQEEALMAIGEVANATEAGFLKYLDAVMPPVVACLRNRAEYEVCGIAVGVVGDICRAITEGFAPHAQTIMSVLLEDLQAPELDRSVKPLILSAVGDVAVSIKAAFLPYLPVTMTMLSQAAALKVDATDEDQVDYLNKLRESIFEAYTGIIHGLGEQLADQLAPHVATLLEVVKHVYGDASRNEAVTCGLVGVIGDLAQTLGERLRPFPAVTQVKQIVLDISSTSSSTKVTTLAKWAKDLLMRI